MKNPFNRLSLRIRITLLTGSVILAVSVALTLTSIKNAVAGFDNIVSPVDAVSIQQDESESADDTILGEDVLYFIEIRTAEASQKFNDWSIVSLVLFSAGGMGLAWILAGRALAPVQRLEAAVSDISARNLSARLAVPETRDEVGRLTAAFNGMLGRLEQSFEQQKRFSSSVAHELKTPLATMKMSLQVARMEGQADDELLSVTERNVDRLIDVVGSLLDLTNESIEGLDDRIALCPLLREAAEELACLYHGRSLQIKYDFADEGISVAGSAVLIRRLFGNLIENAMKYNTVGGEIHISVKNKTGGVLAAVEDSGPGIPEEALPHIFEPFYCADPSRSRRLGGAGLGLSVALTVAERHGWELSAENRREGGAVFTVEIPSMKI